MKLSEHKNLKLEILALPPKEKDKLLLRLVAKDKVLTEHLHFLLLENEEDLKDRVDAIKSTILEEMQLLSKNKHLNARDVLTSLRKLAKLVNHNLRVTKAVLEDVELRIFLYNNAITDFKGKVHSSIKNYEDIFATYFVKAVLVTLRKFEKLHEDLQYDLKNEMEKLLHKIYQSKMYSTAIFLNLPEHL
ncbi:hypothetical protein [Pedobacter namyangjuensis]|uniref:hypothetical protein n=1 Tax=Pedobacter namyangjuensis TaxID=600626 RepID=UPI000DE1C43B|nr:hypothetical protein [Pedobacter namyangjuensis]